MIHSVLHAKLASQLEPSINLAYLKNGTTDQFLTHLDKEVGLSGLENDGELPLTLMKAPPPYDNPKKTIQGCMPAMLETWPRHQRLS